MIGNVKWFLQRTYRRVRHLAGDFAVGEVSDRAVAMTNLWDSRWPGAEPVGHALKWTQNDRWERFWSLPDGKRYADSPEESDEILRRHKVVLRDLVGSSATDSVLVIAEDFDYADVFGGWSKRLLPGSWAWRRFLDPTKFEPGERTHLSYFWVAPHHKIDELDELLRRCADDETAFIVTDEAMTWIYAPYDGGADVILASSTLGDEMKQRHADWTSNREDGL